MLGVEEPYPHLAVGKTSYRRVKAEGWSTDDGYDRFPCDTIDYAAYRSTYHLKAVSYMRNHLPIQPRTNALMCKRRTYYP